MARPSRSQFIDKLHQLLEHPLDASSLRWISDDAFEVTVNDSLARQALSPNFEFRSLSSFIRQLSYYNFKRLSDRRRSSERRSNNASYIVFTHPSGVFVRGDPSKLHEIVRKTRKRPDKGGRRVSSASEPSEDYEQREPTPEMPAWPPSSSHLQQPSFYQGDERTIRHYSSLPTLQPPHAMIRHHSHEDEYPASWKAQVEPRWRVSDRPLTSPVRLGGNGPFLESPPPIRTDLPPIGPGIRRQGGDNDSRPILAGSSALNHFDTHHASVPTGITIPYTESSMSPYAPSFTNPFVASGLAGPLPSPTAHSFTSSPLARNVELPQYPPSAPPQSYSAVSSSGALPSHYALDSPRDRSQFRPTAYPQSSQTATEYHSSSNGAWSAPPRTTSLHANNDGTYWPSRS